jgi:hypothetical protein
MPKLAAVALSLLLLFAAKAVAAPNLNPTELTKVDVDKGGLEFNLPKARAAKCPAGTEIASGGAFGRKEGSGKPEASGGFAIHSSFPDAVGNLRMANATTGDSSISLRVRALCLPERQLNGATTVSQTVTITSLGTNGLALPCPGGEQIVTGGAYTHDVGQPFDRALNPGVVSSSAPTSDALGWYAAAWNNSAVKSLELTVVAICLPPERMGAVRVKTRDVPYLSQGQALGGRVKCGGEKRALAGGAFWHTGSGVPDAALSDNARVSGNVSLGKGKRWYADGYSITSISANLRIVAVCLAP